ncbi:MAG: Z1 domain-containing protein [Gemmatimonadaceae bacterium]
MIENVPLQTLERLTEALLAQEGTVTPDRIRDMIAQFRPLPICQVSDADAEALARRFEARHAVTMEIGSILRERGYRPWLDAELAGIDFYYWNRYRKLLESKHLSHNVISTLHRETDRILALLEKPSREGQWGRRGMVVGDVQSGKTANYTGLICKAADAGYRLIVVIAGVHNNLRNQTQRRIDEGFVGRDSARLLSKREDRFVGVGRFDATRRPVTFTNSLRDFSKQMATGLGIPLQTLKEPAVLVIKKNPKTLQNLLEWLREHNAGRQMRSVDVPMLLIDDEADNASINVAYKSGTVSTINGQIRDLLQMFSRSCYVGYTATPFANIFIDPDTDDDMRGQDLFPRDFIVSLESPTNYFGAARVFRDDSDLFVRHVEDYADVLPLGHKKDHPIAALPGSMVTAVRTFVVGRAIRLLRGHRDQHCSMLINASRFTGTQGAIRNLVQQTIEGIQGSVRVNGALPSERALGDPEIAALQAVWEKEFVDSGYTWAEVQVELLNAAAPIRVVEVNGGVPRN